MNRFLIPILLFPLAVSADGIIPKVGSCPIGFRTSGEYCIPIKSTNAKEVVVKIKSCPIGYRTSNNYCIKVK